MYFEEPFPHIYAENAMPEALYEEILETLPPLDDYLQTEYHPSRYMLNILEEKRRDYWLPLLDKIFLPVARQTCEAFGKTDYNNYHYDPWLIRDFDGYSIPPHTDVQDRVINLMFYLPKDDSLEAYGTCLCVPVEEGFTSDGTETFGGKDDPKFMVAKRAPFRRNFLLTFPRSDTSFHCVPPIDCPDIERNTLLIMVRTDV